MSLAQMEQRMIEGPQKILEKGLPWTRSLTIEIVTVIGKVTLDNYKLDFSKMSVANPQQGFATISPQINESVEGVLYKLSDTHVEILDFYEGIRTEHYMKNSVEVRDEENQSYSAIAYVAHPSKIDENRLPSEIYKQTLLKGASEFNLSAKTIEKLNNWKVV